MYLLPLLTLLGSAFCIPLSTEVRNDAVDPRPGQYVLPTDTIPTFYDVSLFFNPDNPAYFEGRVAIRILPLVSTSEIVLHAMELEIAQNAIQVFTDNAPTTNLFSSFTMATDDTHFLRIQLSTPLNPMQPATINIEYRGQYAANMFGLYLSTYEQDGRTVSLVTSQMAATFARRAFPCYDEPALKAIFRTTIYAPPAYNVVRSNMDLRTDLLKPDVAGYTKHEFRDTLVMSTYLIAYLVSNLDYIDNTVDPLYQIPFRVYSRPGTQEAAKFALEYGQKNMLALEEYTDFKYEFPKMDKVAAPDFAAGAMENWGLVIYREAALLVTEGLTTTASKQFVGSIVCHENMHQWFGNEVGPQSWTYTWLNEGFANFFENYATDLVLPEWRMMDQFVIMLQNVFQSGAVLSVNPMTHPVYTPAEIMGTFNAVAYQKSGSVIRMMQHYLTPDVFQQGLIYYIKANSRKAASPENLYASLQQALDESIHSTPWSVATIMDRWVNQGGFPVLTVTRSASTAESVVVEQERFLTDSSLTSTNRWHVPVNWVLSSNPDFTDTKPQHWIPVDPPAESINIQGLSAADWYIFNKQQTGYYRVNYDLANWASLAKALDEDHTDIHLLNRGQLLDDSFNLARNGRLKYDYAFELSRYLVKEKDYIPWASVNPAFTYLDGVLSESSAYELFQHYILNLTEPIYSELGFIAKNEEEHVTPFHRNIILNLNCRYGNPDCIETAQDLLQNLQNNPTQRLNPDIQTLVYCSGLRGGSVENFNFLWDMYLATSDPSEQSILLSALGCTSNEERRSFYLNQVIAEDSQVREQDRHSIIVSVTNASPDSTNAALDFVIENFNLIQPSVQGMTGTTNILNTFARRLTSEEHSNKVDELYNRHLSILTAGELASIGGIRENIAASIIWTNDNAATVEAWLTENYGEPSGAAAITSSLIILISVFMAVFNH